MRSMMTAYGTGSSIAVPPSFTNSAVTPESRRATSSMNAGGNDHSRPTTKPIFSIGVSLSEFRVSRFEFRENTQLETQTSKLETPQSCPPIYIGSIFAQYCQSWYQPSQILSAFPMPLDQRRPEK